MGNNYLSSTPKFEIPAITYSIPIYKALFHGKTNKKGKEKSGNIYESLEGKNIRFVGPWIN
jgi:hypothetical protein